MKKPVQTTSQAHPWHGITPGDDAPSIVTAYIEIVPTDAVKYELDKESGILKLDARSGSAASAPRSTGSSRRRTATSWWRSGAPSARA